MRIPPGETDIIYWRRCSHNRAFASATFKDSWWGQHIASRTHTGYFSCTWGKFKLMFPYLTGRHITIRSSELTKGIRQFNKHI